MTRCAFFPTMLVAVAALACPPAWAQPADAEHADDHAAAEHAEAGHGAGEHGGHGAHDLGHGNARAGMESMTEVRTDLAIYTLAVFLILATLLGLFVWPKISKALLEREQRIEQNLAAADAANAEAKRLLAEQEAKLAGAAGEVRALLEEARRDAEAAKSQIMAEARTAAQQERDRALRDIDVATDQAMKNLAETSANLAVELAGKAIRETIQPAKAQELVREALSKLSASSVSRN